MPLDGHSYLVAQGWSGKGSGLRQGAISRPLAIPQKRTLAGLGKDRDDAFPFWDHVFALGAKTIQIKLHKDDDEDGASSSDAGDASPAAAKLTRTSTGLISHKRPHLGTPASSGSVTPATEEQPTHRPRMSIMAQAKREVARKGLYSRFFRGPVLAPEIETPKTSEPINTSIPASPLSLPSVDIEVSLNLVNNAEGSDVTRVKVKSKKSKGKEKERTKQDSGKKEKKRKEKKNKEKIGDTEPKDVNKKEKKKRSKELASDEKDVSSEGRSKKRKRSHDLEDIEKKQRKKERKEQKKALKAPETADDDEKPRRKTKRRKYDVARDGGEAKSAVETEGSSPKEGAKIKDKSKKRKRATET